MKRNGLYPVAALLFAFLALTFAVRTGLLSAWEDSLFRVISAFRSPPLTALAIGFSTLGGNVGVAAVCLFLLLPPRSRSRIGIPVTVSTIVSAALNVLLKSFFQRERPDPLLWLVEESSYSFPSGHSMTNAALYAMLAILAYALLKKRRRRAAAISGCILIVFCIGLSRVYLGVHYGGDVFGGWLLGTAIAFCVRYASRNVRRGKG